jgi:hypothetical protein
MPNRYKREMLNKYTPEELEEIERKERKQQCEDGLNYPELYDFFYDSYTEMMMRKRGLSPLSKERRAYIRKRFENNEYPERLHGLVHAELNLKHPEE